MESASARGPARTSIFENRVLVAIPTMEIVPAKVTTYLYI
jgi:hypothetical protein